MVPYIKIPSQLQSRHTWCSTKLSWFLSRLGVGIPNSQMLSHLILLGFKKKNHTILVDSWLAKIFVSPQIIEIRKFSALSRNCNFHDFALTTITSYQFFILGSFSVRFTTKTSRYCYLETHKTGYFNLFHIFYYFLEMAIFYWIWASYRGS